ncbi:component of gems protein 1-like [Rosa chinensis]|uniref:component of gems protein 1-like n=1 Tax=Rosa chinensis TaxID=74649 RepID=UPI000D08B08D|nr:component of gems protein 1-like [Rosa chinensis]
MDYSYTQTPQPDPNQYQHPYQSQPQQPPPPYDPSTIQPYDPNHHYQYYNPTSQDYTTNPQLYQEPTSIHPPGVPIPAPLPQTSDSDTAHLQNAYYGHGVVENQHQQPINSGSGSSQAPVSEITQFPAKVEVA